MAELREATWMRTDFEFGQPFCVFVLGVREAAACGLKDLVLKCQRGEPGSPPDFDALERGVQELIHYYRPGLEGGAVLGIEFQIYKMEWLIWYTHPKLPKVPQGREPNRYYLVPPAEGSLVLPQKGVEVDIPGFKTVRYSFDSVSYGSGGVSNLGDTTVGITKEEMTRQFNKMMQGPLFSPYVVLEPPDYRPIKEEFSREPVLSRAIVSNPHLAEDNTVPIVHEPLCSDSARFENEGGRPVDLEGDGSKVLTPVPLELYADADLSKHPRYGSFLSWLDFHRQRSRLNVRTVRKLFAHYLSLREPGGDASWSSDMMKLIPDHLFDL